MSPIRQNAVRNASKGLLNPKETLYRLILCQKVPLNALNGNKTLYHSNKQPLNDSLIPIAEKYYTNLNFTRALHIGNTQSHIVIIA